MDSPERPPPLLPVACTLTGIPGAFAERMAEYQRLFRPVPDRPQPDRGPGIRFRFRAEPGVEDWVRDLARREKACCGFFDFTVSTDGQEIRWDAAVADDERARQALDGFYRLPDTLTASGQAVRLLEGAVPGRPIRLVSRDDDAGTRARGAGEPQGGRAGAVAEQLLPRAEMNGKGQQAVFVHEVVVDERLSQLAAAVDLQLTAGPVP